MIYTVIDELRSEQTYEGFMSCKRPVTTREEVFLCITYNEGNIAEVWYIDAACTDLGLAELQRYYRSAGCPNVQLQLWTQTEKAINCNV